MILERIACVVMGYVFGLFQTGFLYGKANHIDIRQHGSGNAGATNTLRVMGLKAAVVVFLGDVFKTVLACALVSFLYGRAYPEYILIWKLYAGLGVVLGHNYPCYLQFKGGKGIASTAGFMIATGDFRIVLACVFTFLVIVAFTRYVSLGSIVVMALFFTLWVLFTGDGSLVIAAALRPESIVLAGVFAVMGIFRHRTNILRLLKGTENKISFSKKE